MKTNYFLIINLNQPPCFDWMLENVRCTFSDKLDVAGLNLSSDGVLRPALHGSVIPLRVKIELQQADCPVAHKLTRGKINELLKIIGIHYLHILPR